VVFGPSAQQAMTAGSRRKPTSARQGISSIDEAVGLRAVVLRARDGTGPAGVDPLSVPLVAPCLCHGGYARDKLASALAGHGRW